MTLYNLASVGKESALEQLQQATIDELWDSLLQIQVDLGRGQSTAFLSGESWWNSAKSILEIGSGNGAYLSSLAGSFEDKTFVGIEKQEQFVRKAKEQCKRSNVTFFEGDACASYEKFVNAFDVVIFRLALQHIEQPELALEYAIHYLKPGGHILIYESIDSYRRSSHPTPLLDEAIGALNRQNEKEGRGDRKISLKILGALKNRSGPLAASLDVLSTNLEPGQEDRLGENRLIIQSQYDRELYATHILIFAGILNKSRKISVDLLSIFDEFRIFLEDPHSWICPGWHQLILRKL